MILPEWKQSWRRVLLSGGAEPAAAGARATIDRLQAMGRPTGTHDV
ncbi:hypothetical protein HCN51_42590 [Nonomuraea sp. FMUSA5-5]|uniref:Uncharacterized protein n=1 Tax=Nonomuraea composti TaxID=2720023 RepID=A0ABX1BHU5_9ACTN|nr:hypothetical protein [Nonomuraea sp. FMUSA5-5]NJP96052.1 hypothetical protein [Nonomuraea sp. FMUSA5-5]